MNSSGIARAAVSGLLIGAAIACGGGAQEPAKNPAPVTIPEQSEPVSESQADRARLPERTPESDPNCCAGKNECKGLGGCKTPQSDCAGKNACKGLGGCKTRPCQVADERGRDCCK